MIYALRLRDAIVTHWLRLVLGIVTGAYVAFGVAFALMLLLVAHDVTVSDATLALVIDGVLFTSMAAGALIAYHRRPGARA